MGSVTFASFMMAGRHRSGSVTPSILFVLCLTYLCVSTALAVRKPASPLKTTQFNPQKKNPNKMHVMWTGFGSNLTADIILSNMVPHSTAHFLSSPFCGLLLFFPFPAFFSLSSTSCSCALFLLQSHYLSFLSLSGFDHPCERSFL